jgi:hypothetical protein
MDLISIHLNEASLAAFLAGHHMPFSMSSPLRGLSPRKAVTALLQKILLPLQESFVNTIMNIYSHLTALYFLAKI